MVMGRVVSVTLKLMAARDWAGAMRHCLGIDCKNQTKALKRSKKILQASFRQFQALSRVHCGPYLRTFWCARSNYAPFWCQMRGVVGFSASAAACLAVAPGS
jgi:hypothetical protein